jgi:hypothetical protein
MQGEFSNDKMGYYLLTRQIQIDVNKANRIFDFMIHSGWIGKA